MNYIKIYIKNWVYNILDCKNRFYIKKQNKNNN